MNQFNILLLSVGALQGLLISIFLFRKKDADQGRIYFALFLVVVGLQLTFKAIAKGWLWYNAHIPYLLSYSLPFLIGPFLYLFIRSRTNRQNEFSARDLLHLTPFLIHFTNTGTDILFNDSFLPPIIWRIFPFPSLELISLLTYTVISWRLIALIDNEVWITGLKKFLVLVAITEVVIIITIALMVRNIKTFPDVRLLFVALTGLIYWVSYRLFSSPDVFLSTKVAALPLRADPKVKYAHSGLKQEEADRIANLVRNAIKDRIFLEHDISIEALASRLGVPRHHLSRVINEHFGKTYAELANSCRLEEARARLTDPKYKHHTIYAIALDSGFSSVPSFNTMFKRHFGCTPNAFRAIQLKEKSA